MHSIAHSLSLSRNTRSLEADTESEMGRDGRSWYDQKAIVVVPLTDVPKVEAASFWRKRSQISVASRGRFTRRWLAVTDENSQWGSKRTLYAVKAKVDAALEKNGSEADARSRERQPEDSQLRRRNQRGRTPLERSYRRGSGVSRAGDRPVSVEDLRRPSPTRERR